MKSTCWLFVYFGVQQYHGSTQREFCRWWLQGGKVDCFGHSVEVLAVGLGEEDRSASDADATRLEPKKTEEKLRKAKAEAEGA